MVQDDDPTVETPLDIQHVAQVPAGARLSVVYLWGQHPLGCRLVEAGEIISVGSTKRATFVAPDIAGLPRLRRVLPPRKRGHSLRVWPGMSGQVSAGGQIRAVADLLASPVAKRLVGKRLYRDVAITPGDAGDIGIDDPSGLRLRFEFVAAPEIVGRPTLRQRDPFMWKTFYWTAGAMLVSLLFVLIAGHGVSDRTEAITPERMTRDILPTLARPKFIAAQKIAEAAAKERKRKDREAAESKRMKDNEGKLGRADATHNETILPKGRADILREKVNKTGLLAVMGSAKAQGSGLGKLLLTAESGVEQAINGLAGARLVAGRGTGGLGLAGAGQGGGGTGFGRIAGSGELNVGAGSGHGRKGPSLGAGKEKEVSVGMDTGSPEAEGGLTKDQINRVVRAHAAAVRYCYEKELQREPSLSGKIDLYWLIHADGTVDKVKVAKATLENRNVHGCILRQVMNWQFPRSNAQTIVQLYPFLFKGGG